MNKNILPDTKFFFTEKKKFSFPIINFCPVLVPYNNTKADSGVSVSLDFSFLLASIH